MKFSTSPLLAGLALAGMSSASSYISNSQSRSSKIIPSRHVAGRRMSHPRSWSPKRQMPSAGYAPLGAPLGNTLSGSLAGLGGIVAGTPLGALSGAAAGVVTSMPLGSVVGAAGGLSSGSPLGLGGIMQSTPLASVMGSIPLNGVIESTPLGGIVGSTPLGGIIQSTPLGEPASQHYAPGGLGAVTGMIGNPYTTPNGQISGPLGQWSPGGSIMSGPGQQVPSWPLMGQVDNSADIPNTLYGMASGDTRYMPLDGVPSTPGNIVPNSPAGGIINPVFHNPQGLTPVRPWPLEGVPSTWGGVVSQPGAQSTPFGTDISRILPLGDAAGTIPFGGVAQAAGGAIQNSGVISQAGGMVANPPLGVIAPNAPGPFRQIPHAAGQGAQYNYGYQGSSDPIQFDSSDDKKPFLPVGVAPFPIAAVNSRIPHSTLPVSPALPVSSPALPVSPSALPVSPSALPVPVPHPTNVGDDIVGIERVNGVTSALPVHIPGPVAGAASSVPKPSVVPEGLPTPPAVVPQLGPEHAPSSSSSSSTSATETVSSSASESPISPTGSTTTTASTKPTTLSSRFFGVRNRVL